MKKFLSYVLTFVIMFMLSATGTIWLAKTANNSNNNNFVPSGNNQGGAEQTSFFSGILSTFNENQQFNISGDVEVIYEDKQLNLNLFASIDIQDKTNIKVDAIIKTEIEGRTFAISAIFYDNTIYISFNDVSVKAKIDNIKDLAALAKNLIPAGSGMENVDIAAKMEEMLPALMGSLNNPETSTLANGDIKNVIDMKDLAIASIVTNSEGLLKSAEVETYELYGLKAKVSANIEFDKSIAIENPETRLVSRDYLDLQRAMNIVSNLGTWENFKTDIDLKVESEIGNYTFGLNVLANTKEKAFMLNLNSCSEPSLEGLKVKFIDGQLYVCLGDIKILVSDELLSVLGENVKDTIAKFVNENENLTFDKETVSNLLDKIKTIDISNVFETLDKIKKLQVENNQIVFEIEEGYFVVNLSENKIENIVSEFNVNGNKISFTMNAEKTEEKIENENKEEFFDVYKIYQKNIEFYQSSAFDIKTNLELLKSGERFVSLNGNISFDFEKPYLSTQLLVDLGKELAVNVVYENDIAYVQIADIFVKMSKSDFEKFLEDFNIDSTLEQTKNQKIEEIKTKIKNEFENIKFEDVKQKLESIKSLKVNSSGVEISVDLSVFGLEGTGHFILDTENFVIKTITFENFGFGEYLVNGDVCVESNAITFKEFDKTKYLDVYSFAKNVMALQDLNNAKLGFNFNVNLEGNDVNLVGDAGFNRNQKYGFVNGRLVYNGNRYNVDVQAFENDIYAKIEDIAVKVNLPWIVEIVKQFTSDVNAKEMINSTLEKLKSYLPEKMQDFDLSLLESIKGFNINANGIFIDFDATTLGLNSDVALRLEIRNNQISALEMLDFKTKEGNEISFKIDVYYVPVNQENIEKDQYLDVEEFASNLMAFESMNSFNAKVNAGLYEKNGSNLDKVYDFDLGLNKQLKNGNNTLNALLNVVYGGKNVSLEAILQNNKLYASFNNFKVKIDFESVLDTVHKVLETFGKDPFAYDDMINKVISVLSGSSIKDTLESLDLNLDINVSNVDILKILSNIKNVIVNANKILVEIDGNLFGSEEIISLEIELENSNISKIKTNRISIKEYAVDLIIEFNSEETTLKTVSENEEKEYIILDRFADVAIATYETLKNKVISGTMHIDFIFGGEHNIVLAEYGIKYDSDKNRLSGYIKASFNGVTLNVYYVDSVFYVDLGGVNNNAENRLQIKAEFSELNDVLEYIKEKTGADINIDFNEIRDVLAGVKNIDLKFEDIRDMIFGRDLGFVKEAIFGDGTFEVNINNALTIFVNYKETVSSVLFRTNVVEATIYCENFNDFAFNTLDKDTYNSYKVITNAVDSVLNTIKTTPLEFFANLSVYKNSALNFTVDAGYQDENLFMNIKGLKVRVQRQKLAEILSYALQSMGIDPSIISFIGNVSDAKDLDTSNLQELIPELDLGNPFSMLKYLKGIVLKDGVFEIDIDSRMLGNANKADMKIFLKTENNWISSLKVSNVFVKQDTSLDVSVVFDRKIQEDYGTYIDISNSADLVKAFVNTSALNEYRITGNVKLGVGNTDLKNVYVKVDARVILDENKNPIIQVDVSNYPLIGLVNGKNTNGVGGITGSTQRTRTISVYYKNGEMLLKTSDEKWGAYKKYDRVTKITPSYLTSNLKYYMQWLLGFEDFIQDKINSAIDTSNANKQQATDNGKLDLSGIIKKYEKQGNTHYLDINIGKIAYNNDIGTLSIMLTTVNNAKTGNKDYIGYLDINLDMLDNMISLKTDNNNKLQLENIVGNDSTVSVSTAESELADGTFKLDGEYERKGNGSFSQTNRNSVTITLDNNGGNGASSISGSVGDGLSLPTPTKVVDNGITCETYKFLGYYDANGNKFTRNCFPRQSITLYAKWELEKVEEYKTLTIEKNNGEANQEISKLQHSTIKVDALADYVFDNGIYRTNFTFVGWSLNGEIVGKETTITLENNTILVAVWSENTRYYRTVTFDTNGKGSNFEKRVLEGETIVLSNLENVFEATEETKTTFGFAGWFIGETKVETLTVSEDVTLLASWEKVSVVFNRTLTFMHGSTLVASVKIFAGDNITIPTNALLKSDTKFYLESGFKTEYTLAAMPDNDLVVYIRNKFTISFNANGGNGVASVSAYEGEKISLSNAIRDNTGHYEGTEMIGSAWYNKRLKYVWTITSYTFTGWKLNGSNFDGTMLDHDITVEASWSSKSNRENLDAVNDLSKHNEYKRKYGA